MDEKRYYRNRSVGINGKEAAPVQPETPKEQKNSFGSYMFGQAVICLTVLGLILLSKLASLEIYSEVKAVFSDSHIAKTEISEVFSQGVRFVEELPVFAPLFEKEEQSEQVLIEKTEEDFAKVNAYEAKEVLSMAVCPVFGGTVTSGYGLREDPFTGETKNHQGIDVGVNIGTGVAACFDGLVLTVASDDALGNYIVLEHENGLQTIYAHLLCPLVQEGQTVLMGDRIGLSGNSGLSTGPHLHFAITQNGRYVNPLDYVEF